MNIIQVTEQFPDELDAIKHFEDARWPKSIKCPYCQSADISNRRKDLRFFCQSCQRGFSVTVNTHLHNTRMPLKIWLVGFAIVTDAKKGLSAMQLQRNLGIHYESAWKMYHVMRQLMAMDNKSIDELEGILEMDETFIGPRKPRTGPTGGRDKIKTKRLPELDKKIKKVKDMGFDLKRKKGNPAKMVENPKRGRGTAKIPVVGIVERNGDLIAEVMRPLTIQNLTSMVEKYTDEDDSVIITDEYKGYNRLSSIIEHLKIDHQKMYSYKGLNTNTIESAWALIKRQIVGQHHWVSPKHLPKYIAEFVFKWNNRHEDDMFTTLVKNSMKVKAA